MGGKLNATLAGLTLRALDHAPIPIRETYHVTLNRRQLNTKLGDRFVIYHMDPDEILPRPEKIMDIYPEDAIIGMRLGETVPLSINWLDWLQSPNAYIADAEYEYDAMMVDIEERPLGSTVTTAMITPLELGEVVFSVIAQINNGAVLVATIRLEVEP